MRKHALLIAAGILAAGCAVDVEDGQRIWSDTPAATVVFDNQDEMGLSSDIFDNIWEGDSIPVLPRVKNPSPTRKRWYTGEGVDYLDEETYAATGGRFPNATRLWEGEPFPIGNGRIAAMVFNGSGRDRYALNEVSYWSGGLNGGTINDKGDKSFDGENGPEVLDDGFGGSQPVGDLIVDFGAAVSKGSFVRELLFQTGEVHSRGIRGGVGVDSWAFCSYPDQVMVLRYESDRKAGLNVGISYATQRPEDKVNTEDGALVLSSAIPNGMRCMAKAVVRNEGGMVDDLGNQLRIKGADACTIVVSIETNYEMDFSKGWRGEEPEARIARRLASAGKFEELEDRHLLDYKKLYDKASLKLPDSPDSLKRMPTAQRLEHYKTYGHDTKLEETAFNLARFLMIQTSRPGSLPAGLQGIWNGMIKAPWGNDYHSNINMQMVYWLPEVANLSECHKSLTDYFSAMREPNRIATREYLDAIGDESERTDGWIVYTSHNPFGGNGWQVNLPGSAWYCLHMWEHFAFGQDTTYLRKVTYPMMREVSRYWAAHLKPLGEGGRGFETNYTEVDPADYPELAEIKEGTLVVPNGWSPEHGPRGEDGVSFDQQIVSELFLNTIKASEVLGIDRELADTLRETCARMAQPRIGSRGNLQEWMIDRDPDNHHRHTSHLFAVYPGNTISLEKTPELAEAARKAISDRDNTGETEWAWPWRAAIWARLHDGEMAHEMISGLMSANMLPNMLTSHKIPLQMDGNYGVAAAMCEMLVQSHGEKVELIPAIPAEWTEGSVRGLKARGGYSVSFSWKNGKVVSSEIRYDK